MNAKLAPFATFAAAASLGLLLVAAVDGEPAATPGPPLLNQLQPEPDLLTGGVPKSPERLAELATSGYRTLLDLRTDAEVTPDVAALVEKAGMRYERLPVAGDKDLDLATARVLHDKLHDPALRPMAVVCGSGNRSGALLALESFWLHGEPAAEALERGHRAGLTKLEPSVRQLLGLPPAAPPEPAVAATPAPAP